MMIIRYLLVIAVSFGSGKQEVILHEYAKKENCEKQLSRTLKDYPGAKCNRSIYLFPTDDEDLYAGKTVRITNGYYKGKFGVVTSSKDTDKPGIYSLVVRVEGTDYEQPYGSDEVSLLEESN